MPSHRFISSRPTLRTATTRSPASPERLGGARPLPRPSPRSRSIVSVALAAVVALPLAGCRDALEGCWEGNVGDLGVEWTATRNPDSTERVYDIEGTWSHGELGNAQWTGTAIREESDYPGWAPVTLSGELTDPEGNIVGTLQLDANWSSGGCSFFNGDLWCVPATLDGRATVDGAFEIVEAWFSSGPCDTDLIVIPFDEP